LRSPGRYANVFTALSYLIVDDSEEFLASASRLLESQGLEIVGCASSGDAALTLAETLRPDVALVDIELGDEDGVELARKLSADGSGVRVVLISSYERDDLGDLIANTTAIGFLPKSALGAAALERLLR
jgi:DNA-binding NarL/FixJ family response regulator